MLFKEDFLGLLKEGEEGRLYYASTTKEYVDKHIVQVLGIKLSNGDIRTIVQHMNLKINPGLYAENRFDKVLTPAKFEEFLVKFNRQIQTTNPNNKLIEVRYPNPLFENKDDVLIKETRLMLTHIFLILSVKNGDEYARDAVSKFVTYLFKEAPKLDHADVMRLISREFTQKR